MTAIIEGVFGDGGRSGAAAATEAARLQSEAAEKGIGKTEQQLALAQGQFDPYVQAGGQALGQQQALLGLGGQEAQEAAFKSFGESPGQRFIRQRQEKALLRNQAGIGGLGGGNVRTALQEQAAGFAAQDYGNQLNRLSGMAGRGQQAVSNLGQLGSQATGQIAGLLGTAGQAGASGVLGAQQARQQGQQQMMSGLGSLVGALI